MPHPRSLPSWEGKKKSFYFCNFICSFLETNVEGAEILWEQSHMWDENKVLSSCTGRGDVVIAPGRFSMFKTPSKDFSWDWRDTFLVPKPCALLISPALTNLVSEEPWKTALPIAPGSLRIDPNTAQGCRKCTPRTKS